MDFSALITTTAGYTALAFLPPIVWLVVYMREDKHAEPIHLVLLTFLGGVGTAIGALIVQKALLSDIDPAENVLYYFAAIALIEEYMKYLAVKLLVLRRRDFNEPIDAMIYMVTAGMGFAALENLLFLAFQSFDGRLMLGENLLSGARLSAARFIGANLLHALSSAVVGYFLARAWFHPKRHHFVALGVVLAAFLHALFNYLIILKDTLPGSIYYLSALLGIALVIVLIDFHTLQKEPAT